MAGASPNESKREKFVRLANNRVNTTIKQIELIGNLGNRMNYDYNSDDVKVIFEAIDKAVKDMKSKFDYAENTGTKFELK